MSPASRAEDKVLVPSQNEAQRSKFSVTNGMRSPRARKMNNFAGLPFGSGGADDRNALTAFDDDALLLEPAVRDMTKPAMLIPSAHPPHPRTPAPPSPTHPPTRTHRSLAVTCMNETPFESPHPPSMTERHRWGVGG